MAEETPIIGTEPTLEEQVAKLFSEGEPQTPPVDKPPNGEPPTAPVETVPSQDQPEQKPTEEAPEPSLEDKLKAIEDEVVEDKEAPKLSPEQEQILKIIPSVAVGKELYDQAQAYLAVEKTFTSGDFDGMEKMFRDFSPQQYAQYEEYLYQKYLGKDDKFIQRWLDEKETGPQHKHLTALEKKLADLEAKENERQTSRQRAEQAEAQKRVAAGYTSHMESLFEKISFNKSDRRYVAADIHNRVMANPEVAEKVRAGQYGAINRLFKEAVTDFSNRDKVKGEEAAATLKAQETKKPLPAGGASPVLDGLSDDINQVPADKRDSWVNQQITKLFASKK